MAELAANSQFPIRAVGKSGQSAFVGVQRVFFEGTTGLIGTMYGIPGVTATRVSTGIYRFKHDPCLNIDIIPGVEGPTGTQYHVNIPRASKGDGHSGSFDVHLTLQKNYGFATGIPSAAIELQNPSTGTALKLLWFCSPIDKF